jgi:serine/threonine protein kinase
MDDRALWSRIEGIFHSALERKRAERADYVRTACEGDEDLRLRVESLLAHDDSGSSLGALTGCRLGPYEILAPLGAGGMGEIYRARDTRLDRTVAVKILRRHLLSNPQLLERFKREAQVIARLSHPHICTLHDVGHQDGIDFLVMELVDGESLRALLHRGQVPIRKAIDIAVQIADGMAAAHTAGITHRDLKPENVMVTKVGRVKILDFGLARQMATEQGPPTIHDTQPGTVVGTVNYMSPEQASGLPVDYRSDQFAFGLMLYELVALSMNSCE